MLEKHKSYLSKAIYFTMYDDDTSCHCIKLIISHASQAFVWRNKQKLLQAIVTFGEIRTLLKEYRGTRKGMKDKRNRPWRSG